MTLASLLLLTTLLAPQEILEPPVARHAVADRPAPGEFRPVLDIRWDGCIGVGGEWLYVPEVQDGEEEPLAAVRAWLTATAERMSKDHLGREDRPGPLVPDDALLLRPDRSAPFRYVQKVMEVCGERGIMIWKIQLACRTPEGSAGRLAAYRPKDVGPQEPVETLDVRIRVREPGTRFEPFAPGDVPKPVTSGSTRFVVGDDRALEYSIGPFKTQDLAQLRKRLEGLFEAWNAEGEPLPVVLDPYPGTIYQDVTAVLDELRAVGFTDVQFAAARD